MVSTGPKKRPEMESIIERVSKKIPGTKCQGVKINTIPIPPSIKPVPILKNMFFNFSFRNQK
jgi:hypothetical protein